MTVHTLRANRADRHWAIDWAELGLIPDALIRAGIRRLARQRLEEIEAVNCEAAARRLSEFVASMNASAIAPRPDLANAQHYEVPAEFFASVLGIHRKYSACYWTPDTCSLDDAEVKALDVTIERAGLRDGMRILELGCGWGSLSLRMAEQLPASRITAVSNSRSQRAFIEAEAQRRGLANLTVLTSDMNDFVTHERFDRIVSVEMFEHMRNWRGLFGRISRWLVADGRFFMHIFCHRSTPYAFTDNGAEDWMSRHFFAGGIMPSVDLPLRFQDDLQLAGHWRWSGVHYEKTANAWLAHLDARRSEVLQLFGAVYGEGQARMWLMRWRMFFMACAELFGYDRGQEWLIGHYLFAPRSELRS